MNKRIENFICAECGANQDMGYGAQINQFRICYDCLDTGIVVNTETTLGVILKSFGVTVNPDGSEGRWDRDEGKIRIYFPIDGEVIENGDFDYLA